MDQSNDNVFSPNEIRTDSLHGGAGNTTTISTKKSIGVNFTELSEERQKLQRDTTNQSNKIRNKNQSNAVSHNQPSYSKENTIYPGVPKVSLQKRKLEVDFDLDPRTGTRHKRGRHHNHRAVAAGGGGTSGPTSLTSSWPSPFSKLPAIGSVGESWDFVETKRAPLTERQEKLLRLRRSKDEVDLMKKLIYRRALGAFDRANHQAETAPPEEPEPQLPSTMVSQNRKKIMTFERLRMFVNEAPIGTLPIQPHVLEAIQRKINKKYWTRKEQKSLISRLFDEVTTQYEESMKKTNVSTILREPTFIQSISDTHRLIWDSSTIFRYEQDKSIGCDGSLGDVRARMTDAKEQLRRSLFILNPTMQNILALCQKKFNEPGLVTFTHLRSVISTILREPTFIQSISDTHRLIWDSSTIFRYEQDKSIGCDGSLGDVRARMTDAKEQLRRSLFILNPTMQNILALCQKKFNEPGLVTFTHLSVSEKLRAKGTDVTLNVAGIHETKDLKTEVVSIKIKGPHSKVHLMEALVHPSISLETTNYEYNKLKQIFNHLTDLPNKTFNLMDVGIILGQDAYELQSSLDYRAGTGSEPFAVLAELGWAVSGPMTGKRRQSICHFAFIDDVKLTENIQKWFLWRPRINEPVQIYEYQRHVFGAKRSPTCANYALKRVGLDNEEVYLIASKAKQSNFYMDGFTKSVETPEEASELFSQLRHLLSQHGFQLTNWIINSDDVCKAIPVGLKSISITKQVEVEPNTEGSSVLGLQWTVSDGLLLQVCRGYYSEFGEEMKSLKVEKEIPKSGKILQFLLFLDEENLFGFRKEYLPALNNRQKCRSTADEPLTESDLVWLIQDRDKRGYYNLGRVTETIEGSDRVIRSAKVRTNDGVYKRPVVKLALVLPKDVFVMGNRAGGVKADH
ncbi:uncharacterized protein LOC142338058 [Convolutriloba macropyga]|uniref:uncharacterized protein LOC142338058 n=1 Tax=Convolutriloba macropyga TaxID=536237 RepID=UPI003F520D87